jgi:hypothetical protein
MPRLSKNSQDPDDDLRERLKELDEADVDVSEWVAGFIESVAFGSFPLSAAQREKALEIVEEHGF